MEQLQKTPLLGMTRAELKVLVSEEGLPAFAAKQLAQWVYQKGMDDIRRMSNISIAARQRLAERYEVGFMPPVNQQVSSDGTRPDPQRTARGDRLHPRR